MRLAATLPRLKRKLLQPSVNCAHTPPFVNWSLEAIGTSRPTWKVASQGEPEFGRIVRSRNFSGGHFRQLVVRQKNPTPPPALEYRERASVTTIAYEAELRNPVGSNWSLARAGWVVDKREFDVLPAIACGHVLLLLFRRQVKRILILF